MTRVGTRQVVRSAAAIAHMKRAEPGKTKRVKADLAGAPVAAPETRRAAIVAATSLAELARAERLDSAQLVTNIRLAFGSLRELQTTMRQNHGALGDLLYSKSVDDLATPERKKAVAEEATRVKAFDDALKSARTAKTAALDAAKTLGKDQIAPASAKANSDYLVALKAVADAYKDQFLPAVRRNEMMLALKNTDFGAAVEYYEATAKRWPAYATDDLGREYYVVANNKTAEKSVAALKKAISKGQAVDVEAARKAATLLRRSISEGKSYVAERSGESLLRSRPNQLSITPQGMRSFRLASSEIVAGVGKAFYVLRDLLAVLDKTPAGASKDSAFLREQLMLECRDLDGVLPKNFDMGRAALEVSTRYYEAAYNGDFAYYPAMPAIYQNFEIGNAARAEAMLNLAQLSAEMAGGAESKDFWCLQSQLEIALMQRANVSVVHLLERVLPLVTEGWHIDTCANRMRGFAEQRAVSEGESTNVQLLRLVATEFAARANDLYSGAASPADEWNASLLQKARDIAKLKPVTLSDEVIKGRARTAYICDNSFSFRSLTTSHSPGARLVVGGNYAYGGQIPNTEVTRASRRQGLDILSKLQITAATPVDVAEEKVRAFIDTAYRYVRNGERVFEDLHGATHKKELDPFAQHRFEVTNAKARGDDATELFTDLQMGIGDCRPANWCAGYLLTLAQNLRIAEQLRLAYAALPSTTHALYCPQKETPADTSSLLRVARNEIQRDYRVMSWILHAPIAGTGPYDFARDAKGRFIPTADGRMIQKEDHTGLTALDVDSTGVSQDWVSKDVFYQVFYPNWNRALDLKGVDALITGDLAGATSTDRNGTRIPVLPISVIMETTPSGMQPLRNSKGDVMPYAASIAVYSSGVMRPHDPEKAASHAGVTFAGAEVAPANPASLLGDAGGPNPIGERRRELALSIARAGYVA